MQVSIILDIKYLILTRYFNQIKGSYRTTELQIKSPEALPFARFQTNPKKINKILCFMQSFSCVYLPFHYLNMQP